MDTVQYVAFLGWLALLAGLVGWRLAIKHAKILGQRERAIKWSLAFNRYTEYLRS